MFYSYFLKPNFRRTMQNYAMHKSYLLDYYKVFQSAIFALLSLFLLLNFSRSKFKRGWREHANKSIWDLQDLIKTIFEMIMFNLSVEFCPTKLVVWNNKICKVLCGAGVPRKEGSENCSTRSISGIDRSNDLNMWMVFHLITLINLKCCVWRRFWFHILSPLPSKVQNKPNILN